MLEGPRSQASVYVDMLVGRKAVDGTLFINYYLLVGSLLIFPVRRCRKIVGTFIGASFAVLS